MKKAAESYRAGRAKPSRTLAHRRNVNLPASTNASFLTDITVDDYGIYHVLDSEEAGCLPMTTVAISSTHLAQ